MNEISDTKKEKITIRVSDDEKILLKNLAKKSNLSVSDFLRNIIFNSVLDLNNNLNNLNNSNTNLKINDIIKDIFANTFKNYYLTYEMARKEFGHEEAKAFIDKAKERLISMENK